ncbi:MAG: hypothetical protein ABUL62_16000 [Myxococcales bacterium]
MAETIACLLQGKLELLDGRGRAEGPLPSQLQEPAGAREPGRNASPIVSVTRGRARGELYYAIRVPNGTALFARTRGSSEEQRLFLGVDAQIREIDFSFGDEALACTVPGPRGTSAIGSLADDGKGVRTVTEGDVVDCTPRWAPGGRGEILYASAGVGRTQSGAWGGLAPFALHRLRFADNSVEVLTADARYDYLAPIAISDSLLYAIRRPYLAPTGPSPLAALCRYFAQDPRSPGRRWRVIRTSASWSASRRAVSNAWRAACSRSTSPQTATSCTRPVRTYFEARRARRPAPCQSPRSKEWSNS